MFRDILELPKVAPRTSRNVHFLREGKRFWRKALRNEIKPQWTITLLGHKIIKNRLFPRHGFCVKFTHGMPVTTAK